MVAEVREAAPNARPPAGKPDGQAAGRPAGDRVLTCPGFDNAIRWRPGERLEQLFERRCDWLHLVGWDNHLAVDALDLTLSYAELDGLANQLARFLVRRHGVRPGDRIGLLSDRAVDGYVGMLAVLKARAAYVPLDAAFPPDRLAYIASDAGVRLVLSRSHLAERVGDAAPVLCLDQVQDQVGAQSTDRLGPGEAGQPVSNLCYVIYTSGSTGRPKGVAIQHASICNFIRVADEVYGITCKDRVYQGMTIAFDFSVEEIWVPWMAGATLVPKPDGDRVLGRELHAFLRDRRVTAMCCVPTLLATLDEDLPRLRFLLVSGEPCPQDLVTRWHRPGRRFLNVYGPTEATVTATWTLVHPGRPVTIGVPLPSYSVVVLDPDTGVALPRGAMGEIGIAGIGLAKGYLNRPDLTGRVFITDFLGIPNNPSGLIYRTGDLGRVNADGAIEHHGRIDTQVKIRGYRIELTEIESVLLRVPGIAQAVVSTHRPAPDVTELAGYYSLRRGAAPVDAGRVLAQLRERLPRYMVPAYLEELPVIPMLPSGKADRKSLPAPRGPRVVATAGEHAAPVTGAERALAEELAKVLDTGSISVDGHFFDELGASSLLMARFSAAIRERGDLPPVSMKDIYLHPTVRQLAAAATGPWPAVGPAPRELPAAPEPAPASKSKPRFWLCGALQLLAFLVYVAAFSLALDAGAAWAAAGQGALGIYERLVVVGGGGLLAMGVAPVIAKWLLIGRWKPRRIRVWSPAYFRFWLVKTMIVANPLARMAVGTPLYTLYFRMLGARIGRRTVIFTTHAPVCTDLVTVGAGTVICKDVHVTGYHAQAGVIEIGPVTLGRDVFVGEHTVIDIHAALADGAQIGHASALLPGQSVPAGECWHGSPAGPAEADCDYRTVAPARCGAPRRIWYSLTRLVLLLAVAGPVSAAVASLLVSRPSLAERGLARLHIGMIDLGSRLRFGRFDLGRLDLGRATLGRVELTNWIFYVEVLAVAGVVFLGVILAGLIFAGTVPRLLSPLLRPGRVYPLYGVHHGLQRFISRSTNIAFFNNLFGDSSAVVRYLGLIGYRLKPVEQTGSNFGMEVRHEMPRLSVVGQGTMVSDGLTMVNAEFSSTSFRVVPAVIGARNFLGNGIVYPAGGRTGDDCLLATKVMIPVAGPVREGVGLLGSPCFEIPRSVQRDHRFDHLNIARRRRRQLKAKNRHNAATAGLHLLVRWLYLTSIALVALLPLRAGAWFPLRGDLVLRFPWLRLRGVTLPLRGDLLADALVTAASVVIMLVLTVGYFALVERAVTRFRRLQPRFCSVYEPPFWRHERFWKVPSIAYIQMFSGTPFKSVVWRLLGVRVGRRVFDDGCSIVERTLVQIGAEATLNAGCILQGHSLEGGAFKSGPIAVGARCTIGTGAFVHYGITMGDGAVLEADSFLMKGEHLAPGSRWLGNPAANASVRRAASRPPAAPPQRAAAAPDTAVTAPPPATAVTAPPPATAVTAPPPATAVPALPPATAVSAPPAAPAPPPTVSAPPQAETTRLPKRRPNPAPRPQRAAASVSRPDPLTAPQWPPPEAAAAPPPGDTPSPPRPEPAPPRDRLDPLTAPHWPPEDPPDPPRRTGSRPVPRAEPPGPARQNADLQPQPGPGR